MIFHWQNWGDLHYKPAIATVAGISVLAACEDVAFPDGQSDASPDLRVRFAAGYWLGPRRACQTRVVGYDAKVGLVFRSPPRRPFPARRDWVAAIGRRCCYVDPEFAFVGRKFGRRPTTGDISTQGIRNSLLRPFDSCIFEDDGRFCVCQNLETDAV